MSKRIIAFDLDDTLTVTKSPIDDRMGKLLVSLLDVYELCIISGGNFEQFKNQVVDRLEATPSQLTRLHLMPTCGTRYYRYSDDTNGWQRIYAEDLKAEQKGRIVKVLKEAAQKLGYWEPEPYGEIIEDRGSQITFSALGQQAPSEEKYKWDPDGKKKHAIRDYASPLLLDVEVRVGGTTSIDVTTIGIDKAYGMKKLMQVLDIHEDKILFIGDRLEEGGNDYPVRALGIDCLEVKSWQDTAIALEAILYTS